MSLLLLVAALPALPLLSRLLLSISSVAAVTTGPFVRPSEVTPLAELTSMNVDYAALAELLETLSKQYLKDWVDRNR